MSPPAASDQGYRNKLPAVMAPKGISPSLPNEKSSSRAGRSPVRSPRPNGGPKHVKGKPTDYTSEGVTDNDIFLLPGFDLQLLGLLTVVAALVRLFRIYKPTSVVFDEVQ